MVNCVVGKGPQFCGTNFSKKNFCNNSNFSFKGEKETTREPGYDRFHSELKEWKPTLWQRIKHTFLPGLDRSVERWSKEAKEVKETVVEKVDNTKRIWTIGGMALKSLGVGLIAGTALSIPTLGCKLIKQGLTATLAQLQSTIASSSALGGLLGTGGTILYLDNKSNKEIEELSEKYTIENIFKNVPKIGKNALIGGAIGLIGSAGVYISNFIKNKSFQLPKNAGLLARILSVAGVFGGIATGIYHSEWKIEKNA